jgi:riboflavin kinase/FMN adenylyltransferase
VVSVGNFDGVHLGHAALLRETIAQARSLGGPAVAVTFDPHPLCLLDPQRYMLPLTSIEERAEQLQRMGADHVVVLRTTPELLSLSPEAFFKQVLLEQLQARGIVEGFNFQFGKDRSGNNQLLAQLAGQAEITFREVAPFARGATPVSSSRVRDALVAGDIDEATALLDRPYRIRGKVVHGVHRGHSLGFPTANLDSVTTLLPKEGVYVVIARVDDKPWGGAANIGPNPTFHESARKIEVHIIDFEDEIYGKEIIVEFLAHLRDTKKFDLVHDLKVQLAKDIEDARNRFEIAR